MNTLDLVIKLAISLLVICMPIGGLVGIVFVILYFTERKTDKVKAKKHLKWGGVIIVAAPVLLFLTLSIWGLVRIVTNTAGIY